MSRSGYVNDQQERGRLYFLVGLPHAGKSSYANDWIKRQPAELVYDNEGEPTWRVTRPRHVVAGDDYRWALTGHEFLPHAESHVFSVMDTSILADLRRGFDVLVDETSTSRATLLRYLRMDVNAEPIFVDTPREECERRAVAAGRQYLLPVIERLHGRFERLKANWPAIREELLAQVEHRLCEVAV